MQQQTLLIADIEENLSLLFFNSSVQNGNVLKVDLKQTLKLSEKNALSVKCIHGIVLAASRRSTYLDISFQTYHAQQSEYLLNSVLQN
jgi:hypothetical protein